MAQVVFITGGNTGLGFEVVKALAQSDTAYEIIIGCRTKSKGDAAIESVKSGSSSSFSTIEIDLESDSSIENAVESLSKYGHLDVLINNGGAAFDRGIQEGKYGLREGLNKSWDVNVTGTHVLTTLAMPLLLKSSNPRLLFITSGTSSISETDAEKYPKLAHLNQPLDAGWPKPEQPNPISYYRSSKTGLNMLMREWHRILGKDGVKVWAVSPGFLATGLSGLGPETLKKFGALDPHVGGEFIRDVVQGKRDADVGLVIRNDGEIQPW